MDLEGVLGGIRRRGYVHRGRLQFRRVECVRCCRRLRVAVGKGNATPNDQRIPRLRHQRSVCCGARLRLVDRRREPGQITLAIEIPNDDPGGPIER